MALQIFKLVGSVFIDTKEAVDSLHKTDKEAQGMGKRLKGMGKVAKTVGKGVLGVAAAVGGAVIATAEKTREYREEQAKLTTAWESAGKKASSAKQVYSELNAVLGDSGQAVEASNHLAKLVTTQKDLTTWTDICTGVFATFGDSLPIENLTEASNETAKTGQITGGLADALNWAGISEDDFQEKLDACSTEQERAQLITDTLNGLYGEAADKYRENAGEILEARKAQEKLNEKMSAAGEAFEPAITAGKNFVADCLEAAMPLIEWLAETGVPALIEALEWLGEKAETVFDFIDEHYNKAKEEIANAPSNRPGLSFGPTLPYVPPKAAKGGVVQKGEVALLEGDGAEAIVPLENNRKWIAAVARDMGAQMGGGDVSLLLAALIDIRNLLERNGNQSVVLDTGALVGAMAGPMDAELGKVSVRKERG